MATAVISACSGTIDPLVVATAALVAVSGEGGSGGGDGDDEEDDDDDDTPFGAMLSGCSVGSGSIVTVTMDDS